MCSIFEGKYLDSKYSSLGHGNYVAKLAKKYTILLVGRSQTGKSTIAYTLYNPQLSLKTEGYSQTKTPRMYGFVVQDTQKDQLLHLNLIDTPGLGEASGADAADKSRADSDLLKLIKTFLMKELAGLNAVAFVAPINEVKINDYKIFRTIQEEFLGKEFSKAAMLILTHCDQYTEKDITRFLGEIKAHDSDGIVEYCQLGILKYGAVSLDTIKNMDEEDTKVIIQRQLKRIETYRTTLIDTFIKQATEIPVLHIQEILKNTEEEVAQKVANVLLHHQH